MITPELLCMGCMSRRGKTAVCGQCGYFDQEQENPQQLPPHTILEGKYVIGRALGQGGFGITYLGYDLELNKKLAIKEYFPVQISTRAQDHLTVNPISRNRQDLDYGLEKFAEEAKALTHFRNHPGVVSMLDFLYAHGTAYIVMGYVDGRDLKEYLKQHGGKIAFEEALKILLLVMAALEDVHRAGIVHRDISPDNIYVEANGAVKILDFGATRYAMGEQSRSLSVVLKPGYAPEEQYRGKGRQGSWTDIYALGATFYRCITGQVPPDALDRMVEDELVAPSKMGIAIPEKAEAAVLKALALKAENRFQTVAAFREAVQPQSLSPAPDRREPPPVSPPPRVVKHPPVVTPAAHAARLPKAVLLTAIAVLLAIFYVVVVTATPPTILGPQLAAPVILFALMMFVFSRMWKAIQDGQAQTAPETAVAFCFIPGFNLYWAFPVFWGFARDYNRFLERHVRTGKRLNETLFFFASITYVAECLVMPFEARASVLILANACFLLPAVAAICDAVNGLGTAAVIPSVPAEKLFCLYGVSGEYQGQTLGVNAQGTVIGRSPAQAKVVLSAAEVSGQHARVWQDGANAGVWIEDLKSTNGTFCRPGKSGEHGEWVRVAGNKLLFVGDRFRLSVDGPEFEVRAG